MNPALYSGMRWRQIGPFRGGRVTAVAGIPGNEAAYYMGTAGGGLWETDDAGWVWRPIFDQAHVASIGAIAVAPSNPSILYVGTGDVTDVGDAVNQGDGMWKSTDGGRTWTRIGLDDTRHIASIVVDPRDPNLVLVAALGHTFAPNSERGVFRSTDGGRSWTKVLYLNDTMGAVNLASAPDAPKIVFAALWYHYDQPGKRRSFDSREGGAIYKSSDEGRTWKPIAAHGLPASGMGRIGLAVGPGTHGRRVYAIVSAREGGVYRSDDGGATWRRASHDPRVVGNGYFSEIYTDPRNPDIVYVGQTSLYRSRDGGQTFVAYKGAPGGDDNHVLWIDPAVPRDMILGSDQGATISLDGGHTWSSWYNQPTGQIYHLSTDHRFPFWVYGTQQDSGSIGTSSRGDYGEITFLDWDAVGGYEFGYIVPDPLDPDLIYAGGPGRGTVRIDRRNHQVADISPDLARDRKLHFDINPPLVFSPEDPHLLLEGSQYVLATRDGGAQWRAISPDLAARADADQKGGFYPAAISSIAPSPVTSRVLWAGTNDGLIQVTRDGGATWRNVSPPAFIVRSYVDMVTASPWDPGTAFVAMDQHAANDFKPYIYRTRDFGRTWTNVVDGIPDGSFARVVRADPKRRGLLYAGTEDGVYVSFDDGDHWQSLQLNLPTVSVRDLALEQGDLVAATYGRSFWILDDLSPLRQAAAVAAAPAQPYLYRPETAMRVRRDENQDTPLPPEMPAGTNPPAGAIIDYYLPSPPAGEIELAIFDRDGQLVRQFSSAAAPAAAEPPPPVPSYWLAHPEPLPKQAGMNRFVWDLRYTPPPALRHGYPISAVYEDTPADPRGPFVAPGEYQVRLTVEGKTYSQPLAVAMDPRVHVSQAALEAQLRLELQLMDAMKASYQGHAEVAAWRARLAERKKGLVAAQASGQTALAAIAALDRQAAVLEGSAGAGFPRGPRQPPPSFGGLNGELGWLATAIEQADTAPTAAAEAAAAEYTGQLRHVETQWSELQRASEDKLSRLAAASSPGAAALRR
ncbi:MAG TPA: glycoside hydrolase [Terriglobales bacterium]|nr:glycoside hydrolase [Terriglobales bacterium]